MEARLASLDIERLIGEVARRHNVLLSPDDPIFVAVTLNELVAARTLARAQAALDAMRAGMADAAAEQREAAKAVAAELITRAADYAAQEIRHAGGGVQAAIASAAAEELARLSAASAGAQAAQLSAWRAALLAATAAGLILGTLFGAWLQSGSQPPPVRRQAASAAVCSPAGVCRCLEPARISERT